MVSVLSNNYGRCFESVTSISFIKIDFFRYWSPYQQPSLAQVSSLGASLGGDDIAKQLLNVFIFQIKITVNQK